MSIGPLETALASDQALISGRVVALEGADTLVVASPEGLKRVRLSGIVAPPRGDAHHGAARRVLAALVFNREVQIVSVAQGADGAAFGRVLAGGRDVSLAMLRAGAAWAAPGRWLDSAPTANYLGGELAARQARRGVWEGAPQAGASKVPRGAP